MINSERRRAIVAHAGALGLLGGPSVSAESLFMSILRLGAGLIAAPGPRKPAPSMSAAINRWTGKPHEHNRAKARRLRQMRAIFSPASDPPEA